MPTLYFTGDVAQVEAGLALLCEELGIRRAPDGLPVCIQLDPEAPQTLRVDVERTHAAIVCRDRASCFRGLSHLLAHLDGEPFSVCEARRFTRNGIMFDCSRNAVANLDALRYMLRRMALMGLDWAMMYTEETYELDSEPYFGYCRGRYSEEELRALDDYADALGIELIPCIQTLSHLERFLHWPAAARYRDTQVTLMVGNEDVYDLIERMLQSAVRPYRSRRIHIGMDEAWDLGRGERLSRRGYTPPSTLMAEHLRRVREIVHKLGLQAMMWSDMHFENAGPGGYYGEDKVFTDEIVRSAPADIDLVYWDYYHEREAGYDRMLTLHEQFSAKTVFAGGIWTWSGIAADYRKTMTVIGPALRMCLKHGVREVFATAWGDNGGECPFSTILLGLQAYAEFDYAGTLDEAHLMRRFAQCVGADGRAFLRIGELHHPFEREKPERGVVNVCKPLLYEDPLIPLFERDFAGESMQAHYAALQLAFLRDADAAPQALQPMLRMYEALAEALRLKCAWRDGAAAAVRAHDQKAARALLDVADANIAALMELAECWRAVWMAENKPFGFEVVDARVGGVIARFRSAKARMQAFADGELADIPELSCEKLPCLVDGDGLYIAETRWSHLVSASNV